MYATQKPYDKQKKPDKRIYTLLFHLYTLSRKGKSTETENIYSCLGVEWGLIANVYRDLSDVIKMFQK